MDPARGSAMLSGLKCSVRDAPGFSLCVNTLVCPCDESLGLSFAKSTPPHPFPPHRIIRELIVIFYCNLSNRGSSCLESFGGVGRVGWGREGWGVGVMSNGDYSGEEKL